ncbi:cysteine protease LapG [Pseudomonas fluvialis]|jgi:predicted transglutaminase-like cysteine proteinase|nr:transglutaminase-like cysteine peptidase [Pseudomonas pharmacofabricae]
MPPARFFRMPHRHRWFACLLVVLLAVAGSLQAGWDFARIMARAEQLYGHSPAGQQRLQDWQRLLQSQVDQAERQQLEAVNRFFNQRLRFADDRQIWAATDYWATPVQALQRGAADCEDYAIAKYFSLRQLGVPSHKLRITYVKALRLNQAHMVLTYYPSPGAEPLVLDNLIDAIRPAGQRNDLKPVYAFNAEGLWVPGPQGGKQVGDSKRLSRWQDLLKKMQAEGFP